VPAGPSCPTRTGALAWVASVPGDAPFLPAGLVARLHDGRGAAPAAVASSGGRRHPVVGLWSVSLRDRLRADLAGGERRVGRWAEAVGAVAVDWPALPVDPFLNVNEPDDLLAARALASRERTA
jgi:molybdopterin-guanine dinucleotide biosynthesis protein A